MNVGEMIQILQKRDLKEKVRVWSCGEDDLSEEVFISEYDDGILIADFAATGRTLK